MSKDLHLFCNPSEILNQLNKDDTLVLIYIRHGDDDGTFTMVIVFNLMLIIISILKALALRYRTSKTPISDAQ